MSPTWVIPSLPLVESIFIGSNSNPLNNPVVLQRNPRPERLHHHTPGAAQAIDYYDSQH